MSRAYIQRWRRWWYQKGGCSAGKISMDCECVDWACLCMYVSRFACVFVCCCDFFSLPIRSLLRLYPFNSTIQWCTSRINGKRAHAHTHIRMHTRIHWPIHTCVRYRDMHPIRNIFIYAAAASMTIIACFCCIIIARVLWRAKKKRNVK